MSTNIRLKIIISELSTSFLINQDARFLKRYRKQDPKCPYHYTQSAKTPKAVIVRQILVDMEVFVELTGPRANAGPELGPIV